MAGSRVRSTKAACNRKADSGDYMFQLYLKNGFPIRHKAWKVFQWLVFCFTSPTLFPYSSHSVSKLLVKFAWRLAVDAYRTYVPLMYPPHTVALGCLYLAALLTTFEQPPPSTSRTFQQEAMTPLQLISLLGRGGEWEDQFNIDADHLERTFSFLWVLSRRKPDASCAAEIAHEVIDLFAQFAQNPTSGATSANTSPSTPSSPPRHVSHSSQSQPSGLTTSLPFKSDQLMRLKIAMRDREAERPPKTLGSGYSMTGPVPNPYHNQNLGYGHGTGHPGDGPGGDPAINEGLGRNVGTVRFLFGSD